MSFFAAQCPSSALQELTFDPSSRAWHRVAHSATSEVTIDTAGCSGDVVGINRT